MRECSYIDASLVNSICCHCLKYSISLSLHVLGGALTRPWALGRAVMALLSTSATTWTRSRAPSHRAQAAASCRQPQLLRIFSKICFFVENISGSADLPVFWGQWRTRRSSESRSIGIAEWHCHCRSEGRVLRPGATGPGHQEPH